MLLSKQVIDTLEDSCLNEICEQFSDWMVNAAKQEFSEAFDELEGEVDDGAWSSVIIAAIKIYAGKYRNVIDQIEIELEK